MWPGSRRLTPLIRKIPICICFVQRSTEFPSWASTFFHQLTSIAINMKWRVLRDLLASQHKRFCISCRSSHGRGCRKENRNKVYGKIPWSGKEQRRHALNARIRKSPESPLVGVSGIA
ncbi:uncharacterized protein L969DRAFT_93016 [Mixia osmundae IAM 14324]|uniref:Uncharacterized protein n=1 Tax=Mixia osmundae (strain CBS 9802 / IAM 14324 / JCM 22182 / KY 12970) TaxID=764103 RepID=G7E6C9_MIXOS|nr:uncharacterized protein L969DRAFT_93016 [Mixia osmundae IAM 14324]KEI40454.1 hypothetical protein L969DRAFT_93016 [Mixia osmundae IAM 14324]GAA98389.1 hypothetical protein E5Q_05075 [Mixia osmundae IAM 14324]